jgi:hypothetical protein
MIRAMSFALTTEQFPYVFTKVDGESTLQDLEQHIAENAALFARKQPFVQVTWLKTYHRNPELSARVARWFKEQRQTMKDYCIAIGHISSSGGFRFGLSALFLLTPLPCPHSVDATFDEALAFVRKHAAKRGLALSSMVRRPWEGIP